MSTFKLPLATDFTTKINNKNTHLITLKNRTGMQIALTDYGARLVSVLVPNKNGELIDVVLGYNSIQGYLQAQEQYQGASVGRFCNRIADGKFELNGTPYSLAQNNNGNSLHGGVEGFHRKIWDRQVSFNKQVDFYYVSPDGEEGFPGELNTTVSYELTNNNEIIIRFRARTDKTTVINLTNHAYFNLEGEGQGDTLSHEICIHSEEYLPINNNQIPTGEIAFVEGTVFDFRSPKMLGRDIGKEEEQLMFASGYDHTFVNNKPISQPIASAYAQSSGIELEVYTTEPGIHLYSGNFMADDEGKSGQKYMRYGGFCFEAQHYPDSPNQPKFPSVILNPGEEFNSEIRFKFNIKKEA